MIYVFMFGHGAQKNQMWRENTLTDKPLVGFKIP